MLKPSQRNFFIASSKSQEMEELSPSLGASIREKPGFLQPFQTETSRIAQSVLKQTLALKRSYQE